MAEINDWKEVPIDDWQEVPIGNQPSTQVPAKKSYALSEVPGAALSNAPKSFLDLVGNLVNPSTYKGIGELASAVNPSMWLPDYLLKGRIDPQMLGQFGQQLGEEKKQQYGGGENIKRTIAENPTGFFTDLATILTGIGGILPKTGTLGKIGSVASTAGEITNPMALPGKVLGAVREGIGATKIPEQIYARTMKIPPGSLAAEERTKVIDFLLRKEGLPLNSNTRNQLNQIVVDVEGKVQPTLEALSKSGSEFNMDPIYKQLDELKKNYANRGDAKIINNVIDEVKKKYMEHDFITRTKASEFEGGRLSTLSTTGDRSMENMLGAKENVISRDVDLASAQQLKKGIYAEEERYFAKKAQPETGRIGIKNQYEADAMAKTAAALRESVLSHPDVPLWVKKDIATEAGAMKARKWVERAANRGGNIDPASLTSMAFGYLIDEGVPGAIAYQIGKSQWFQSNLAVWLAHGSKNMKQIGSVAKPATLGVYQASQGNRVNLTVRPRNVQE